MYGIISQCPIVCSAIESCLDQVEPQNGIKKNGHTTMQIYGIIIISMFSIIMLKAISHHD